MRLQMSQVVENPIIREEVVDDQTPCPIHNLKDENVVWFPQCMPGGCSCAPPEWRASGLKDATICCITEEEANQLTQYLCVIQYCWQPCRRQRSLSLEKALKIIEETAVMSPAGLLVCDGVGKIVEVLHVK